MNCKEVVSDLLEYPNVVMFYKLKNTKAYKGYYLVFKWKNGNLKIVSADNLTAAWYWVEWWSKTTFYPVEEGTNKYLNKLEKLIKEKGRYLGKINLPL